MAMPQGRKPAASRMPISWVRSARAASIVVVAVKTAATPMMSPRKPPRNRSVADRISV